jgi:hypothetical protein
VHQRYRGLCALLAFAAALLAVGARAAESARRSIVFVEPASEQLDAALRDALTAQLSGGQADVVFEHFTQEGAPLRAQVSEARSLAHAHDATGVFWLDSQSDKDWLLYLTEPDGERVLVRRVEVEVGGSAAAVEAISVITRQSSDALLAGQTIGMQPVNLPPAPTATVDRSVPPVMRALPLPGPVAYPRQGPYLSVAYVGDYPYQQQVGWQSGAGVAVGYTFGVGVYLGAGSALLAPAEVSVPPGVFRLSRIPMYVEGGFSFGQGRLVPSLGFRAIVELLGRHAISTSNTFTGTPDSTRGVVLLSPRARGDFWLTPGLSAYAALGADFALNPFSFVSRIDGANRVLVEPLLPRPSAELGLTFRP